MIIALIAITIVAADYSCLSFLLAVIKGADLQWNDQSWTADYT